MKAFVSVTRLRLRGNRFLPQFFWHAIFSARQARAAPGHLKLQLKREAGNVFWTLSLWESESAMRAYMIAGAHRKAMPKLLEWCDEAAVAHWLQDEVALPTWPTALRMLIEKGRLSKLNHPSAAHQAGHIAGTAPT